MSEQPVIIITGASSGIGEATAVKFAQEGYRVVLAARRAERLEALANKIIGSGGQAYPLATDVTNLADIQRLVQATIEKYEQIDILFNNAGFGRLAWLEALDPITDIDAQIQVNLLGVIQMTRATLPVMIEQHSGHIINMASVAGLIAPPTYSIYAASKYGLRGFSEALRREVAGCGIKVSVIYPGGVQTEFSDHIGMRRKSGITTPGALRLSAEQVAEAIWRLAKKPKRSVVIPSIYHTARVFNALFPGLVDRLIEKRFVSLERDRHV